VPKASSDIDEERQALRRALAERRQRLSPVELEQASREVGLRLFGLGVFARAGKVALYAATRGEIDLTEVALELLRRGHETYYPRVERETPPTLSFRRSRPDELLAGRYRIHEPKPDHPVAQKHDIDVIVVPALAFDRQGGRLGFGQGYYDAWLRPRPRPLRIGICHHFQLLDRLPAKDHDEPVDIVMTPEELRATSARVLFPSEEIK
jgi:5-formyltetrahydrofolate cyclo-ligase